MRNEFIKAVCGQLKKNKKIFLLVGDLGYGIIEPLVKKYPNSFLNVGVAEQNMAGVAAGIASEGYQVFIYSIANFSTFRCAEQIRNDIDYHNLNVTVVSVGSGLEYGKLGYSHHALQDLALMRTFPNTKIISPANEFELDKSMNYIFKNPGPKYLRLSKEETVEYKSIKKSNFKDGEWILVKKGKLNKAILFTGNSLKKSFELSELKKFKDFYIYSIPIWSMKSKKLHQNYLKKFSELIVVETHLEDGGFSSYLREAAKNQYKLKIKSVSISAKAIGEVGDQAFLEKKYLRG